MEFKDRSPGFLSLFHMQRSLYVDSSDRYEECSDMVVSPILFWEQCDIVGTVVHSFFQQVLV